MEGGNITPSGRAGLHLVQESSDGRGNTIASSRKLLSAKQQRIQSSKEELRQVNKDKLFYFFKDEKIKGIKFFDEEIDQSLKHQVLYEYGDRAIPA